MKRNFSSQGVSFIAPGVKQMIHIEVANVFVFIHAFLSGFVPANALAGTNQHETETLIYTFPLPPLGKL